MTPMMVAALAAADVRLEAQLPDPLEDVLDLLQGGVGPEDDNHGSRGQWSVVGLAKTAMRVDGRADSPCYRRRAGQERMMCCSTDCPTDAAANCRYSSDGCAIGNEPSTETLSQISSSAASVFLTFGSSRWPSKSTKKTYSPFASRSGNDSIQVRLILFGLKTSSASTSAPGVRRSGT